MSVNQIHIQLQILRRFRGLIGHDHAPILGEIQNGATRLGMFFSEADFKLNRKTGTFA
ncbi:hypothetical protein W02_23430 [Nitrospira sp. KM1]|nr:hypothetical protein W02_23430 [Nitrospira sp. KM1]